MNNLNTITVFVRVAETLSFTAAARRLGISASGASKAVSRLENETGVRLINRTTRKVGLTDDGRRFFLRCRQILADIAEAESALTQASTVLRGRLRVQLPEGFGRRVIVPALGQFIAQYPELALDVQLGDRMVDLAEEDIDCVVRLGEIPDSRLITRKLCDTYFITCAAPEYLRRHGEPDIPDDLENHRCLTYMSPRTGHFRNWQFTRDGKQLSKPIHGILSTNSVESLLDAAVAGAGIVSLANFVVADAIAAGRLKIVLRDYIARGSTVSVVYLSSKQPSPRLRVFVDFLSELVRPDAPWNRLLSSTFRTAD